MEDDNCSTWESYENSEAESHMSGELNTLSYEALPTKSSMVSFNYPGCWAPTEQGSTYPTRWAPPNQLTELWMPWLVAKQSSTYLIHSSSSCQALTTMPCPLYSS